MSSDNFCRSQASNPGTNTRVCGSDWVSGNSAFRQTVEKCMTYSELPSSSSTTRRRLSAAVSARNWRTRLAGGILPPRSRYTRLRNSASPATGAAVTVSAINRCSINRSTRPARSSMSSARTAGARTSKASDQRRKHRDMMTAGLKSFPVSSSLPVPTADCQGERPGRYNDAAVACNTSEAGAPVFNSS